jgi:glycine betaine catabolism A
MATVHAKRISAMVSDRSDWCPLPASLYVSQEAFEVDMDVIFHRHWIVAGVDADVPQPGDIRRVDVGDTSIIIIRGVEGQIRAFHNVCRHRGAQLVQTAIHSASHLVCPYHGWAYKLDGRLTFAQHMGAEFEKNCRNLKPVHIRSVAGILLICLADEAPDDIEIFNEEMSRRLKPFDLANTKIACEVDLIEDGNWKLSIDNNRECYHCPANHPELNKTFPSLDVGFDPAELSSRQLAAYQEHQKEAELQVSNWEAAGFTSRLVERMSDCSTFFRSERFVLGGEGESLTLDTKIASQKLLGALKERRLGDLHLWTVNSWHHFLSDHAVISFIIPISPSKTLLRTKWLVHKDAIEGVDYDVERLTEVWKATNDQDAKLVGLAQRGVETTGYSPGPLSRFTELHVNTNINWYISRLAAFGYQ